jgi:hypothetical protein
VIYPSVETVREILLLRICAVSDEISGSGRYPSFFAAASTRFFVLTVIEGWFAKARETVERENPVSSAI